MFVYNYRIFDRYDRPVARATTGQLEVWAERGLDARTLDGVLAEN